MAMVVSHAPSRICYWPVVNARQRKIINMQFDGFFGKLTSGK